MADCGKRWEEDPTCGSSLPKVVPGGLQQFTPLTKSIQVQLYQFPFSIQILCPNNNFPPNLNTHPKLPLNSPLFPRLDPSVQAGRNLKDSWILKSGWTRSVNLIHDQSPLIPPLHLQSSLESSDHLPLHLKNPCLLH